MSTPTPNEVAAECVLATCEKEAQLRAWHLKQKGVMTLTLDRKQVPCPGASFLDVQGGAALVVRVSDGGVREYLFRTHSGTLSEPMPRAAALALVLASIGTQAVPA